MENSIKKELENAKRIVFKFGTNVLRNEFGEISLSRIYSFIEDISKLHKQGKEIIIVTSGAVGLGAKKAGVDSNESITMKQACAAIGQGQLISIYENGFDRYKINTAQILLTEDDFSDRIRYLSLSNVLNTLLKLNVIPVINQNDTVSVRELENVKDGMIVCFSDNDKLSALLSSKIEADLLVILSDIDGLYDSNPKENPNAKLIPIVEEITEELESYACGTQEGSGGRGGMKTKLEAAKVVTRSGGKVIIANGKTPSIISKIFKENVGTLFLPTETLTGKKRWIAYATNIIGKVCINDGAKKAIVEKEASLLPIGVTEIINDFQKGDVVSIIDSDGREFARGIANYNSEDSKKIIGAHSDEIINVLGYKNYDALITRDYIVLL